METPATDVKNNMIMFGRQTRTSVSSSAQFQCPVCESRQPYLELFQRPWMLFFAIPTIPLGKPLREIHCSTCGTEFPKAVLGPPQSPEDESKKDS
jgi:DNA-directed RNA polymerase subunit RPC12/RpoP